MYNIIVRVSWYTPKTSHGRQQLKLHLSNQHSFGFPWFISPKQIKTYYNPQTTPYFYHFFGDFSSTPHVISNGNRHPQNAHPSIHLHPPGPCRARRVSFVLQQKRPARTNLLACSYRQRATFGEGVFVDDQHSYPRKGKYQTLTLGILAHLLRMVMKPKYLAFWRWLYTPIIIWRSVSQDP